MENKMNESEKRAQIAGMLVKLAEYYGRTLTQNQVTMYVEDLVGQDIGQIHAAIFAYRKDPRNKTFPLPSQLEQIIHAPLQVSDDAHAVEAAARIMGAVRSIGPYAPKHAERAIGELGWYVVERMGGWFGVCEMLTNDNTTSLQAQFREIAKSALQRGKHGTLHVAPKLCENKTENFSLDDFAKEIEQEAGRRGISLD